MSLQALQLERGPYLQKGSQTGVTLMWRTDLNSTGKVWYGTSQGTLDQTVVETGPAELIPAGSEWKFLDNGTNQGTAWRNLNYIETGWGQGPAQLGYGDNDEDTVVGFGGNGSNKYITTYFRHTFMVPDKSVYTQPLAINLLRDDGAVVYLNGTELFRSNMPGGTITYLMTASSPVSGSGEDTFFPFSGIDQTLLLDGDNVLAVEIHQSSGTSSDISFDLELIDPSQGNPNLDGINHLVRLSSLQPDTKYFYQIGSDLGQVLAGGDADHYFTTSPLTGVHQPVRIWAIGDSGTADNNARAVRDAYLELAAQEKKADLWLMLGDNAYNTGTDTQYQNAVFQNMYEDVLINTVLWPTQGNHDVTSNAYYNIFDLPGGGEGGGLVSGTEEYYSFDYANIHFICLNSEISSLANNQNSAMYSWLETDLADTEQEWIIAYFHHPPYTKGSHDSDNSGDSGGRMESMREYALPLLEAGGVDLVLSGHSHSYERSCFVNGHYGTSGTFNPRIHVVQPGNGKADGTGSYKKAGHNGAVYIVAGSSGKRTGTLTQHAVMCRWLWELGSMVIDVDGHQMDVRFLREQTNPVQVDDYFRIIKAPPGDINHTGSIDVEDLAILAGDWIDLPPGCYEANLQVFLKFDNTSGSTATDYSCYLCHGDLQNGPQWLPLTGIENGALHFDGIDDQVEIPNYTGISGSGSRSIAVWIRTETTGQIVSWGDSAAGASWVFSVQNSNGVSGALRIDNSGGYIVGTTDLRDGQWHHVAAILNDDGSANVNEVLLYVDGVLEPISASQSQGVNTAATQNIVVGAFPSQPNAFAGVLDELRIYDRVLSPGEIDVLSQRGLSFTTPDFTADAITDLFDCALFSTFWHTNNP
jgi:hypothetical protein